MQTLSFLCRWVTHRRVSTVTEFNNSLDIGGTERPCRVCETSKWNCSRQNYRIIHLIQLYSLFYTSELLTGELLRWPTLTTHLILEVHRVPAGFWRTSKWTCSGQNHRIRHLIQLCSSWLNGAFFTVQHMHYFIVCVQRLLNSFFEGGPRLVTLSVL